MTVAAMKASFADWRPVKTRKLNLYKRGRTIFETIEAYSIPITECGCWIWTGSLSGHGGYGQARIKGVNRTMHRVSFEAYKGEIIDGLHVLHKCDIPSCVNPDHLFLGTHKDNMEDKERKGRGNQPRGERNGLYKYHKMVKLGKAKAPVMPDRRGKLNNNAKLNEFDVLDIRNSNEKSTTLAKRYGINRHTVVKIKSRKCWGHL